MADIDLTENRQGELKATLIAMTILAVIFVGLRFKSRYMKGFGFGMDDFTMVLALIFLFITCGVCLGGIHYGLGRHAAALEVADLMSYGKTLMAFECVYVTCIAIVKVSLLMMYCRIFPVRSIKIGAYVLSGISIAWSISIIMVSIFQCTPIAKTWNPTLAGHCINLKASFVGNAVPNILTDAAILALPMPQVWRLHTSLLQRAQLSFVFLLGSFVIFTSIYRFTTLFQFQPADVTWTLATAQVWCVVESSAAIISACLPTLGPIVQVVTRSLGISTGARSTSRSRSAGTALKTIGGTGHVSKNGTTGASGNFDAAKLSNGSRQFQRLHGANGDAWSENSTNSKTDTVAVADRELRHKESEDSDEIPLNGRVMGIQVRTDLDVEWSKNGKNTPEPSRKF